MLKLSRREILKQLGIAGLVMAPQASKSSTSSLAEGESEWETLVIPLDGLWQFALDPERVGDSQGWCRPATAGARHWQRVAVPHTWQVSAASASYQGVAWYRTGFDAPLHWADKAVRIGFEAVTHSATVWLNGKQVGQHLRKPYTAFSLDLSSALRFGGPNQLVVMVDNSFDETMLPRGDSSDWTTDGGIIRPVRLLITPPVYLVRLQIDAEPNLETRRTKLRIQADVRNSGKTTARLRFNYRVSEEASGDPVAVVAGARSVTLEAGASQRIALTPLYEPMSLWHFDHPHLYRAVVEAWQDQKPVHSITETFGVRTLQVKEGGFYLNGERVRLMGAERMAGSNPRYGMAEPSSWIVHDHDDLKELNCIFTRVHWQQDRRVLDYCDRQGILIQEEVPAWGADTFRGMAEEPSPPILQNGLEQLQEMIARDYNHPSIFAWGLCNEVNGHHPPARRFIQRLSEEARRLDPRRLLTYASNTLQQNPGDDEAGALDFISWNEYYESWYGGNTESVRRNLEEIHRAFPEKAVVISEYGYCECAPDRTGGDARRIEILREHTKVFRDFDFVAGAIFFDYNDYRTHVGDKGVGVLKQRVHGVVDLYGNRKPSFAALREESSPIERLQLSGDGAPLQAMILARQTLPAYTLDGYKLRWLVFGFGDLPVEEGEAPLPRLSPGQEATVEVPFREKQPHRVRVDVLRPTRFSALTAWWKPREK
jgi:beta-glucuronidase